MVQGFLIFFFQISAEILAEISVPASALLNRNFGSFGFGSKYGFGRSLAPCSGSTIGFNPLTKNKA